MSAIRAIYQNLAAMSVTFTRESGASVTVAGRDLPALPNAVQPADAPVRLLLPYAVQTEGRDASLVTLGRVATVSWYVTDLLLWSPGTLTSGIAESAADLVRYQGAYADSLTGLRELGVGPQVTLTTWLARPGLYDWPIGSNVWWQGVMMILRVQEIIDAR